MAAQLSDQPITTFSARFEEEGYDEGAWIEPLTRHVGADARFIHPKPADLIPTLERMLRFHDEPVCTATWFAHWLIMEEVAGMGFPVVLNGHVGDELFAGYWDHYLYNLADLEDADHARFEAEYADWRRNHGRDPGEFESRRDELRAGLRPGESSKDAMRNNAAVAAPALAAAAEEERRVNPFDGRDRLRSRLVARAHVRDGPGGAAPRGPQLDGLLDRVALAVPRLPPAWSSPSRCPGASRSATASGSG